MWSRYLNITDGQTDDAYWGITALCVASRGKNVSTGALIRAKRSTKPGVHKLLTNYQTDFGYKFRATNGWYERIGLPTSRSFMNTPKLNPQAWRAKSATSIYSCSQQLMRYKPMQCTRGRLCLKKSRSRFLPLVFFLCVLWLNDTSYSKSV